MRHLALKSFVLRWVSFMAFALFALTLLTSCGGDDDNDNNFPILFTATLDGLQETPPNASTGEGVGILLFQANTREFTASVVTKGIVETVAHIHQAAPGIAGSIIFPLTKNPGSAVWTANGTLSAEQEQALRAGNLYFNVHNDTFPNGEIRGQILLKVLTQQQLQQLQQLRQQSQQLDRQLQQIEQQQTQ